MTSATDRRHAGKAAVVKELVELVEILSEGPWYIEADAGTGKTYTITSLVVFLVAVEGVPIEKCLIVTYTNKATAELRERIRARLSEAIEALRGEKTDLDSALEGLVRVVRDRKIEQNAIERLERARRDLDLATVSTIHSFCQQVISRWPELVGCLESTEFIEDYEPLVKELVADYLSANLYSEKTAGGGLLDKGKLGLKRLEETARYLCRHRNAEVLPVLPELGPAMEQLISQGLEVLSTLRESLNSAIQNKSNSKAKSDNVSYAVEVIERLESWLDDIEKGLIDVPGKWVKKLGTKRLSNFLGISVPSSFLDSMKNVAVFADFPVIDFAEWFKGALGRRLESERLFTYEDLLYKVAAALERRGTGSNLVKKLRSNFHVVLIDEFQDTDMVQWSIFRRGWLDGWDELDGSQERRPRLYLVGDPKQSIYSFRGADVYVCAQAKGNIPAERHRTLSRNWRSDRAYIEALNGLLLGLGEDGTGDEDTELFDLPQFITLRKARYPDQKNDPAPSLVCDPEGKALAPIEFVWLAPNGDGDDITIAEEPGEMSNKKLLELRLPAIVARDIKRLLHGDGEKPATWLWDADAGGGKGAWRPLEPGDIAVLTATNARAERIAQELRRLGIPAVTSRAGSVFRSEAARIVLLWLDAVIEAGRSGPARALAVTPLCGFSATEILAGEGEEVASDRFRRLQEDISLWADRLQKDRVATVLREVVTGWLFQEREGGANNPDFMKHPDSERMLTDFLHLCELVYQFELGGRSGPEAVRQWLLEKRAEDENTAPEDAQLRLETDRNAVQLLTVHKAKGLQFPVVYLPDFWVGEGEPTPPVAYHRAAPGEADAGFVLWVGNNFPEDEKKLAARERLQEKMRLLYVALTRAKHHCRVFFASAGQNRSRAPLARLIERHGEKDRTAYEKINELAKSFRGAIVASKDRLEPKGEESHAEPRKLEEAPEIPTHWNVHSFSSLSRGLRSADPELDELDRQDPDRPEEGGEQEPEERPIAHAAGKRYGDWVHSVLEEIPPERLAEEPDGDLLGRVQRLGRRYGFSGQGDERQAKELLELLRRAVTTPLGHDAGKMALADLSGQDRLHELRFGLPIAGGTAWKKGGESLSSEKLAGVVLKAVGGDVPSADELRRRGMVRQGDLAGLLYGAIDLVFRLERGGQQRYYLADFKSNWLGDARDYTRHNLHRTMLEHGYYLQAVLYAVALHRHLRMSLPLYDPERHFGGVYYLFLRGMEGPETPEGQGIVFLRPPRGVLDEMDRLFRGVEP